MERNRRVWLAVALLMVPLLMGMGGGGGAPISDSIPRPEENHAATLRDRRGILTEVTHLACSGKTYLPLRRGEGTLMVPFALVERVQFDAAGADGVAVTIHSADGEELGGRLALSLEITGVTPLGNYRVPVKGLAEIVLH